MCERCEELLGRKGRGNGRAGLMKAIMETGLGLGMPGMSDIDEMFEKRPKTSREIELDAKMTGKKAEIKYLRGSVDAFCDEISKLTKAAEEKDALIERLKAEISGLKEKTDAQTYDLERKVRHITNLTEGKKSLEFKFDTVRSLLVSVTSKTPKPDMITAINKAKAAL